MDCVANKMSFYQHIFKNNNRIIYKVATQKFLFWGFFNVLLFLYTKKHRKTNCDVKTKSYLTQGGKNHENFIKKSVCNVKL